MRVLIDTNILIDYVQQRPLYYADALKVVEASRELLFDGCIAAHSIPDIYYILRKTLPSLDTGRVFPPFFGYRDYNI